MGEQLNELAEFDYFFEKFKGFIKDQNEQKKYKNDYNVITALLSQSDEVRLHSRFIYSLINPNGRHYNGTLFLEILLKIIGVKDFNFETAEVKKESENIDLYITDGIQHIIIENKIHAYDQDNQICRYINIIKDSSHEGVEYEKIQVFYLTIDSKLPSKSSLGKWCINGGYLSNDENKVLYKNITYKIDILKWLYSMQKDNVEIHNNINQAILSYIEVVEKITKIKKSNIIGADEYLLDNKNYDNLLVAASFVDTFESIKGRLLRQFFVNIDEAVEKNKCAIKYLDGEIKYYSYEKNNCDKWFIGRPRNYNIGTFFKIDNKPIIFGLLASKYKLYFVVRIIGDNQNVDQILKDENILNNVKYKYWVQEKNTKENKLKLKFYCSSLDFDIYSHINKKEILSLLCEKKSAEKIAEKFCCFVSSLNNIQIYD